MNVKELLQQLNPGLFEETLVAEPSAIIVTGLPNGKDEKGQSKLKFVQKSNPSDEAKAAGVRAGRYLRASFKKADSTKKVVTNSGDERVAFTGSKRAQAGNVFENVQPELFNFMVMQLKQGNYKEVGKDQDNNTLVELDALTFGKKVSVNVPKYHPQETDDQGRRKDLIAGTYNPESKKYEKKKVTMSVIRFFADEDDLEELLEVAARRFERDVKHYLAEKVTTITETESKKTVETKEPDLTEEEELEKEPDVEGEEEPEEDEV